MKKIWNFLRNIILILYAIVAITVTILLLSYNQYKCSEIGGYTFIILNDDELAPEYQQGDLLLIKKTKPNKINVGDKIFLYRTLSTKNYEIKYAEVQAKSETGWTDNVSFSLEGDIIINSADVIGSTENMKVIPHLGTVLSILESRYGYLFLVVTVTIVALLYEIYELVMEIKYGDQEETKQPKEKKETKNKK